MSAFDPKRTLSGCCLRTLSLVAKAPNAVRVDKKLQDCTMRRGAGADFAAANVIVLPPGDQQFGDALIAKFNGPLHARQHGGAALRRHLALAPGFEALPGSNH